MTPIIPAMLGAGVLGRCCPGAKPALKALDLPVSEEPGESTVAIAAYQPMP